VNYENAAAPYRLDPGRRGRRVVAARAGKLSSALGGNAGSDELE